MEHTQDVERLFSWLKAPMVHYREFAPEIEVAEAVATWPAVHRTAVQTGVASDNEPGPQGGTAARERLARDRRVLPAAAAQAIHDIPLPGTEPSPTAGRLADVPAGDEPAGVSERLSAPSHGEDTIAAAEPMIAGFDEPAPAIRQDAARPLAGRDRHGLFAGEYRDRDVRPAGRADDRQDRSLDAVFSRLGGRGDRLPDPRERARTTPGLGSVFGRLR